MAVELRNRLNRTLAGAYVAPNTVIFDYPNPALLGRHLAEALGELPAPAAAPLPVTRREGIGSRWWGWRAGSRADPMRRRSGRSWRREGRR